jgi:hypothetical protein
MDDNHLSILSQKERLGYTFESYIQQLLWLKFRIPFSGNPLSPLLWKHCVGKGADIQTDNLAMELKFVEHTVYPCHVKNHVIPRFDDIAGKKKVALTNNKSLWREEAISVLSDYDIELWDVNDLINYYSVPSFISVYNFVRRDEEPTTLLSEYSKYNNAISEYKAKNNGEDNLQTRKESANVEGKRETKSKDELKKNETLNVKEYYGRACFRCGKRFKKGSSSSKYFCSDCVNKVTKKDKKTTLWYSTAKFYLKRFGTQITCEYCQKPINVLEKIETVGQYHQHFYHSSCFQNLVGEDSQKETISYILVSPNGSRKETFEVV